jgi:hypothetical protein
MGCAQRRCLAADHAAVHSQPGAGRATSRDQPFLRIAHASLRPSTGGRHGVGVAQTLFATWPKALVRADSTVATASQNVALRRAFEVVSAVSWSVRRRISEIGMRIRG